MATPAKKAILIVFTHSPYGSSLAAAALDVALANAAFEQSVDLLFLGDGVLQLLPHQDGQQLNIKSRGRQLASLPLYDINTVYVDAKAAARFQLDISGTPLSARLITPQQVHSMMVAYHHLLSF